MTHRMTFLTAALALAGAVSVSQAIAQTPGTMTAAGSLAPPGQGPGQEASSPSTSGRSMKSRASVKAMTRSAEASGKLEPAGQAPAPVGMAGAKENRSGAMVNEPSDRSRASVKASTRAAQASGELRPAGEAPRPLGEMPKR